jgi:hypothetical protein
MFLQSYFVFKLYRHRCRLYAIKFSYSVQTHSSTDCESEIQVSALDLNLFTNHGRMYNNQIGSKTNKIKQKKKTNKFMEEKK